MIEVEDLSKDYAAKRAVEGVSFSIAQGEVVGFLGENGAGKSTTLRMMVGFLEPTRGRVRYFGKDLAASPTEAKMRLGYMPESAPLHQEMRVSEYLKFRAELKGVTRSARAQRISDAMTMADVGAVQSRIIGQLSKGTRQRVALADALVADPEILILDEPTAGLDPNQIRHVREVLRSFRGKKTVFLSTHILAEVESTCERALVIHHGKLVQDSPVASLRLQREGLRLQISAKKVGVDAQTLVELVATIAGVQKVVLEKTEDDFTQLSVECDEAILPLERVTLVLGKEDILVRELKQKERSLEDAFAALTHEPVHESA